MADACKPGLEGHAGNGAGCFRQEREIQEPNRPTCSICVSRWPSCPGEPQHPWEPPRTVIGKERFRLKHDGAFCYATDDAYELAHPELADAEATMREFTGGTRTGREGFTDHGTGQVESEVGGDPDGCSYRMVHAELYEACDNRTDELRLLGNGVCPDTAERAFLVLYKKLMEGNQ